MNQSPLSDYLSAYQTEHSPRYYFYSDTLIRASTIISPNICTKALGYLCIPFEEGKEEYEFKIRVPERPPQEVLDYLYDSFGWCYVDLT